jgi:hypothetical protein
MSDQPQNQNQNQQPKQIAAVIFSKSELRVMRRVLDVFFASLQGQDLQELDEDNKLFLRAASHVYEKLDALDETVKTLNFEIAAAQAKEAAEQAAIDEYARQHPELVQPGADDKDYWLIKEDCPGLPECQNPKCPTVVRQRQEQQTKN